MDCAVSIEATGPDRLAPALVEIIARQTDNVRQLVHLADQVYRAAAVRSIDALATAVAATEAALAEHDRLECQWRAAVGPLAERLGERPAHLPLMRLADELPEPHCQALRQAGQSLRSEVERLAERTQRNQHLLAASSRLVEACLGFLNSLRLREAGWAYTAEGRTSPQGALSRLLDHHA